MLLFDAHGSAAFAETRFQLRELFDEMAHVRQACGVHGYFRGEKSVGSRKSESTFCTILPSFSESAATFFHSGSALNAAQLAFAASRLGWAIRVDQRVLGQFGILRSPVGDAFDAVALEDLDGMVTEARFQGVETAFIAVVGAQFENTRGVRLGKRSRGQQRENRQEFSWHEDSVA